MPETQPAGEGREVAALKAEIVRLNKVVHALMERVERSAGPQASDFSLFQTAIMLEDQVSVRTAELQGALREIEQHRHHLEELVASRTAELAAARDAAEAANRAKSAFLSSVSHELRTPMNGIMGMTRLALSRAHDPQQIVYLDKCMGAAKQLLGIINNIIDVSQIEAERMTLAESDFVLRQLIGDCLAQDDDKARAKGLQLCLDVSPTLPGALRGDALRLRQIVANFVGNAIQFSARGQVVVRASAMHEDSQGILLRVEVSDQGIGLSDEQREQLFKAFTQLDRSPAHRHAGTGLGLVIAKRLAQLMGGDAGVISAPGVGSTFWATVRLKHAVPLTTVSAEQARWPA
jgi:signal transduction histidine kinase